MAAVSLHPLASRSGAQSSTIVSVDIPQREASISNDCTSQLSSSAPTDHASASGLDAGDHSCDDHADLFSSSPTTRALSPGNPFADDSVKGLPDPRPEWGIHHADIDQYAAIDDGSEGSNTPPIRLMTAAQYGDLQERYAALDVPHSVLFPFLHGVDGDNAAQCAFFRAPATGQPTPNYRGLTVVRADMPAPHQRPTHKRGSSSLSTSAHQALLQRGRADSLATTASSFNSLDYSDEDESNDKINGHDGEMFASPQPQGQRSRTMTESKSSASTSSSNLSRASSLFSTSMMPVGEDVAEGDAMRASEAAAFTARANRRRAMHSEPQPMHSMLTSSIVPDELINPPLLQSKTHPPSLQVATQAMRLEELCRDDVQVVRDACFVRPRQADGISLRNFKTQCAKYATISDIVIYCPAGIHEGVFTLAQWVRAAQRQTYEERVQRGLGSLRYNVFIITDGFEAFEHYYPHLVAVDGSGFSRNRIDFVEREREEMQRFTEASEIDENVFMGCTANVPLSMDDFDHDHCTSNISLDSSPPEESNPHAFSICIEATEMADIPDAICLCNAGHVLDTIEAGAENELASEDCPSSDERLALGPGGWSPRLKARSASSGTVPCPHFSASDSSTPLPGSAPCRVYYPPPSDIVHLKTLGSASYLENDMAMQDAVDRIVGMCAWMYKQTHGPAPSASPLGNRHGGGPFSPSLFHSAWRRTASTRATPQASRRILIHCGDGYTDSSILGLAYLMYARRLSLPEAYLDLQNRCQRCFFVYARDVVFLQRIERRIVDELARSRNGRMADDHHSRSTSPRLSARRTASRRIEDDLATGEQSVWARSLAAATGLVAAAQGPSRKTSASDGFGRTNTPTPRRTTPTPTRSPVMRPVTMPAVDYSWLTNPHFQGSFPSRILPFLYLGNLGHAMNPGMLHALGITHVVSVGESAMVPPATEEHLIEAAAAQHGVKANFARNYRAGRTGAPQCATLWEEERCGRISVLDLQGVSDDGIDSLRPHMKRAVEYIEEARLAGGKVLVHCRVGVSRSATICIAYTMAHCDLSMIESFLLVRSRRMNVLTQPTLLFVWELRGFEAQLTSLKARRAQQAKVLQLQPQLRHGNHLDMDGSGDRMMHDVSVDDAFSLAALSISSEEQSHDDGVVHSSQKMAKPRNYSTPASLMSETQDSTADDYLDHDGLDVRQSIHHHEDLRVDIGAGAGSVYNMIVPNARDLPFNSGSLTRLNHLSAKLTHGYFCKALSELNARYMVN